MSLSSTSGSLNSSGSTPFNSSSSSINSTPPVDRYAALKDLDEQLREVVKETSVFGSPAATSATGNGYSVLTSAAAAAHSPPNSNGHLANGANPFKPVQAVVGNPFQAATAAQQSVATNGWATDFGNAPFAQMKHQPQQQQQQHQLPQSMFGGPSINANGYGNGFHQMATNGFGQAQRNPFAVGHSGSFVSFVSRGV